MVKHQSEEACVCVLPYLLLVYDFQLVGLSKPQFLHKTVIHSIGSIKDKTYTIISKDEKKKEEKSTGTF